MREDNDGDTNMLSKNRMWVVFGEGGKPKRACGPYRSVNVSESSIDVMDNFSPAQLAVKNSDGWWTIRAGFEDSPTYKSFIVICPPKNVTREEIERRLGPEQPT